MPRLTKSFSFLTRSALALAILFGPVASITADDIYLKDGRVIEGEIISPPDAETVNIRVAAGGLVAVQHFPKHHIRRIEYGVSARQEAMVALRQAYDDMLKRADSTAESWWALAVKLKDKGATPLAKDAAEQTILLDRHHEEARRMLGMVKYRGVWMRQHEMAAARGEVFFRGNWVSWDVQQQTLADEARRREELVTARKERDEQRRLARLAAAEAAAARAQIYPETYVNGYYRSPYYNPYGGWNYPVVIYGHNCPPGPIKYPQPRPPICFPTHYSSGVSWNIGASGGGSNHAWAFNWNGG